MPKYIALPLFFALVASLPALAQETPAADADGSSEAVEESDEAFRRRMELEDARRRDPGYTPPAASPQQAKEKIDELPAESQANIRDQLVEIIMENGEWEPSDVLEEYPYEPTEAALADGELLEQEQAAWDEQVERYHEREAEAFGAQRPPSGAAGGLEGDPSGAGAQAGGQAGSDGQSGSDGQAGAAGSYQPYTVNRDDPNDEASTAGARQSALDFLRGQSANGTPGSSESAAAPEPAQTTGAASGATTTRAAAADTLADSESRQATERDIPGIIAIEDLDKLEGAAPPEDREEDDPPR